MKKFILLAALVFLALTNYAQNPALGNAQIQRDWDNRLRWAIRQQTGVPGIRLFGQRRNQQYVSGQICRNGWLRRNANASRELEWHCSRISGCRTEVFGIRRSVRLWDVGATTRRLQQPKRLADRKIRRADRNEWGFLGRRSHFNILSETALRAGRTMRILCKLGDPDNDKMVVAIAITGGIDMGFENAFIILAYLNVEKAKKAKQEIIDDL